MAELKRIILEMGSGTDLHGGDYTKAAIRAVEDAMRHSSLGMFWSCDIDPETMVIELTLAAQEPERIDLDRVAATLPYGTVSAKAVKGGLNVASSRPGDTTVIVNAGVLVRLPL